MAGDGPFFIKKRDRDCVCVCVWEREREKKREREREREREKKKGRPSEFKIQIMTSLNCIKGTIKVKDCKGQSKK